jgi:uncharacterized protein (TIGR03790 family)
MQKLGILCLLVPLLVGRSARALAPDEVLVIANTDYAASKRLARYYCRRRGIPARNVVPVRLGTRLSDTISRADYERRLAGPVRRIVSTQDDVDKIKCLVTTYGIPFKVGRRAPLAGLEGRLEEFGKLLDQEKRAIAELERKGQARTATYRERSLRASQLQMDIDRITGRETEASVDSELSLLLGGDYELHRWQPNRLRSTGLQPFKTLMICRIDGPNYGVAKGLIDKAMRAEESGLRGIAYFDSRGILTGDPFGYFDQSVRDVALLTQLRTPLRVREERTPALFRPDSCPQAALYCGWYSLRKYVDAFEFVDGAVGFHIASFEAAHLRDPNSTEWCPAMLIDGVTATLGAVSEPYLRAFPEPKAFFRELFNGACLVEAFYRTKPFNSWHLLLIGDPLYRPFKND